MRTIFALAAGLLALALEGASAYRSSPVRARLVRPAPAVSRASALAAPRALPRMSSAPGGVELCDSDDPEEVCMLPLGVTVPMSLMNTLQVGLSFAAWFFLNVMYNLTNKKCQNVFPMPWTMTVVSLFVGIPYVLFMWATGLRPAPKVSLEGYKKLFPIGVFHAAGHASAVIALGAGAVSFAQIVKSGEPVFTCLLSFLVLGQTFSPTVYASLLPIVGGVALASLKELSFTWKVWRESSCARAPHAGRARPPALGARLAPCRRPAPPRALLRAGLLPAREPRAELAGTAGAPAIRPERLPLGSRRLARRLQRVGFSPDVHPAPRCRALRPSPFLRSRR